MNPLVRNPVPISNPAARDLPFQQDSPTREMQQITWRHGKELAHQQGEGEVSLTPESLEQPLSGHSMVTGALPWRKAGAGVSLGTSVVRTIVCNSTSSTPLGFMGTSAPGPGSGS